MKTILVGYTDRNALSAPEILCGPETPVAEQAKIMDSAKRLHEFPPQIARLEQYVLGDPTDISIFISDETANACQGMDAERQKKAKADREQLAARQLGEANLVVANKAFTAAAQKRNKAIAEIAAQKNLLSAAIPDKDRAGVVAKIDKLQPAVDQANAEFKIVMAAREVIKNPKSEPAQTAAALEQIKNPAKALEAARSAAATETPASENPA
jgi:hypothetical protein